MTEELAINGGKPVREKLLGFSPPLIKKEEIKEVVDSMKSCWLTAGPKVIRFEEKFKDYIGCKHAVSVNSCTSALHLSLIISGIKSGDEVITTPITWPSTANVIIHVGAKPVFVDVEKDTLNIDAKKIEEKITAKTKAIIPVHMAGKACDLKEIHRIAKEHGLKVIEDCAHAAESTFEGKKIGAISELNCFSFYATKNIACGEGGMITTDNDEYADKARVLRLHGLDKDAWQRYSTTEFKLHQVVLPGFKYNWTDLQAGIGLHQLEKVESSWEKRQRIAKKYYRELRELPLELPKKPDKDSKMAWHLFIVQLKLEELKASRNQIVSAINKENIGTGIHFYSLHLQPYYKETLGCKENDFPIAADISNRIISIPLSPKMNSIDVQDTINAMKKVLEYYSK